MTTAAANRLHTGPVKTLLVLLALFLFIPAAFAAPSFPSLTGRVVDAANVIPADEEQRLNDKLAALETQSRRQLVVATIPDLQGYDIADYGYQLGRAWGLGDKQRNDGALLIVAPKERKVRIEVGYGLEGVLTDGLSSLIIQQTIIPKFKAGDMPGGIEAGTDAIIKQLTLPEDEARKIAADARPQVQAAAPHSGGGFGFIWIVFFFLFFILPMLRRRGGRRFSGGGLGSILLWDALSSRGGSGGWGGGFGGGGFGGGGGGGGFSGGGGSFGGGGSSGGW